MLFFKDTTTPRVSEGNISNEDTLVELKENYIYEDDLIIMILLIILKMMSLI